jgi:hypothetical protein
MVAVYVNRAPSTRERRPADARRVTLRRAVPSDAIVAHPVSATRITVAAGWTGSGLRALVAHEVEGA